MLHKLSLIATLVLFFVAMAASLGFAEVFAQQDHMQMGDSMNVTATPDNQTSPVIYEIPNSGVRVKMSWQPEAINTNETTQFTFEFLDTDFERRLQNVSYAVHMSLDGRNMGHAHEGSAPEGIGTVEQKFDSTGSLSIVIESIRVGNDTPIEGAAQFNVVVVPEFPLAVAVMGAAVSGIVVAARLKTRKP